MTSKAKNGIDNTRGIMKAYRARLLERSGSSSEDNLWLFTMTDVMSLLLVCFVMFFIITNKHKVTAQESKVHKAVVVETKEEGLQRDIETPVSVADDATVDVPVATTEVAITGEIASLIRELDLQDDVSVTAMNKDIVVTMRENVSFAPGAATVLAPSTPVLDNIAEIINRYPGLMVEIDGHTDNVPIRTALYPSNWELSAARATSVLRYFIAKHDIEPSRLYVKGNADSRPITPNDTPEHRAQNRRVEIRLKEVSS
ncbi:MAG: flagellar motor protein MotB [Nitrospirae bacterium]|uniref:OmpA/MotB family protein n=1 Tax=Candidatus Magnetobacterium casense TaxID=1455061 RepID=UPI00058F329B|nr:flagellar motor protein MotB [Candidatus Magnetobacterium casensis]MBF0336510.1 flagellar motor protein MotB [Nitrospirota bacterium]